MKKFLKALAVLICFVLVVYIGLSVFISISANNFIQDINNNNAVDIASHIEDEELAELINVRESHKKGFDNDITFSETLDLSFPIFIHWFAGGNLYYKYDYEAKDSNGELLVGSMDIPVTLTIEFKNFNWVITDYYEEP